MPAGYLSERFSPRQLLGLFSGLISLESLTVNLVDSDQIFGIRNLFILVFIFGLTTMPIYSICAIHANDLIHAKQMTSLSASLIFIFALGAIISPVFVGFLIQILGPNTMFINFAALHIVPLIFTGYRALIRRDNAPGANTFIFPAPLFSLQKQ